MKLYYKGVLYSSCQDLALLWQGRKRKLLRRGTWDAVYSKYWTFPSEGLQRLKNCWIWRFGNKNLQQTLKMFPREKQTVPFCEPLLCIAPERPWAPLLCIAPEPWAAPSQMPFSKSCSVTLFWRATKPSGLGWEGWEQTVTSVDGWVLVPSTDHSVSKLHWVRITKALEANQSSLWQCARSAGNMQI